MKRVHVTPAQRRWAIIVGASLAALYLVLTLATYFVFKQRFFPRSSYSSQQVSNSIFSGSKLNSGMPGSIELKVDGTKLQTSPAELGIELDPGQTLQLLHRERHLRPLLAFKLLGSHTYPVGLRIDDERLSNYANQHLKSFERPAKDAHLEVKDTVVSVATEEQGTEVSMNGLKQLLTSRLALNYTSFDVPFNAKAPAQKADSLKASAESLNKALTQSVKISYGGGVYVPTLKEKASWLSPSGNELSFDKAKIVSFLGSLQSRLGKSWDNSPVISAQISDKLSAGTGVSVVMHDKPKALRAYNYCVALRNVDEQYKAGFANKLRSVYDDERGWGLSGKISFVEASSGCDYTVWLSAASSVPSFNPNVCDAYYSCTVGPNVIINFDRWQGATDPWNNAGGSLDDYRSMVINHETGHWLGFGHQNCSGAGQLAPVMQQQSVSLQGCKFNPWPLPSELTNLASIKGV